MAEMFEIHNEDDLFHAIQIFRDGEWPEDQLPVFVDWPHYRITIRGEDFDGGVPTRIMPALLELQRTIRRAYARSTYGSRHRLTREELKQTELVVHLDRGSTTFWSELAQILNAAVKNMSGPEAVVTVLGLAAIVAGATIWKWQINSDAQKRKIDYKTKLAEEETKRHQIITELAKENSRIADHISDVQVAQREMLKRLEDRDLLSVDDENIVTGEIAKQIVRSEHQERIADRIDSIFSILSVESGNVRDGFRVRVRNTGTGQELRVSIPAGTLTVDQIDTLQSGEWGKRPLRLEINVERRGNRILKATLISAGLARADQA